VVVWEQGVIRFKPVFPLEIRRKIFTFLASINNIIVSLNDVEVIVVCIRKKATSYSALKATQQNKIIKK